MSKNYVDLKVSELRDECKNRNLDTTGLKVHLVERLNKYDREQLVKSKTEGKLNVTNLSETNQVEKLDDMPTNINEDQSNDKFNDVNRSEGEDSKEMCKPELYDEKNDIEKAYYKEDRKRPYDSDELSSGESKKESIIKYAAIEADNWESRTDVHLDFYNSDMNLVIDERGFKATPLHEEGFEYVSAGVKANYGIKNGRCFYEVKIVKKNDVDVNSDIDENNFIRIGWSTDNGVLTLGECCLSYAYDDNATTMTNGNSSDYGAKFDVGDVIGCLLEFNEESYQISYSINGISQGEAFNVPNADLNELALFPHIYVKNVSFEVNFGQIDILCPPIVDSGDSSCFLGHLEESLRVRALLPPKMKSDCEVLMMCGLPSCGKTFWTESHIRDHSDKRYNVLSINTVLDKMKVNYLRKKVSASKWDSFIISATQCLNKLIEIAVSRRRNFILDQTNVYPTAQRRRMKPFEEFIRKAIIIVPADDEYQRRMNQVIQEEGKDVPESAVLQMKENFVIPEESSDLFNEIIFIELQRSEAEELIKKYNEEAKSQKKKDSYSDSKLKRKDGEGEDDENFGKWASTSPKNASEDSEPAPKKSRWNNQNENRKRSRSRERYDRTSPERSSRKNDYKGGFCFSREASDSGKRGGGFRSDNRHEKSRDQRSDRSGNRSDGAGSYRRSTESSERKPRFDQEDSRFGNRNQMGGNRDNRGRDRGPDSRGGSQFQSRDRSRGGFSDRRPAGNSYDDNSRNKFPQSGGGYTDRGNMNTGNYGGGQERAGGNSRFGQSVPDRGDFRGRGRGSGSTGGKDSFTDRSRNAPDHREFPNYSDFSSQYQDNRLGGNTNSNVPWQSSDYSKSEPRGSTGFDNRNATNYDNQFGGGQRGAGQMGNRGKMPPPSNEKIQGNQYDRKPQNARGGGQINRGGRSAPAMDSFPADDYSYGGMQKYGNKQQSQQQQQQPQQGQMYSDSQMMGNTGSYKDYNRQDVMAYSSAGASRPQNRASGGSTGGYSSKPMTAPDAGGMKTDYQSRDYGSYDNYQSYDNSQYSSQSASNYNYYGNDPSKDQQYTSGSYQSAGNRGSNQSYMSAGGSSGVNSGYSTGGNPSSASPGYQSATGGSSSSASYNTQTGSGYHQQGGNYSSVGNPGAAGYQSNYSSTGSYQSSYPAASSTNVASNTAMSSPYQQTNYQSSSSIATGTSGQSNPAYTNPYTAIYESSSSYNSGYYGQTNTYSQSGSYGDNSKYSDYSSKPPTDRTMPPPASGAAVQASQSAPTGGQNQANWPNSYGDYSQYYGQYYGQ